MKRARGADREALQDQAEGFELLSVCLLALGSIFGIFLLVGDIYDAQILMDNIEREVLCNNNRFLSSFALPLFLILS